ncbi:MAG: ABC transporter ATP-binding protein [Candidatus Heimdallarchaeota archaeon]|nr:ABC transporter ATP-binding protein [Candidatus Heimdallarchaeota archaeon]
MNNSEILLHAENIHRTFPVGDETLDVLKGVDISVHKGEILVILGPSGAGKSTILHILGMLDKPTSGKVYFKNEEITKLNEETQSAYRNKYFGFIFQFYHLLPEFDVLDNVLMPQMIARGPLSYRSKYREIEKKAKDLLEIVGLTERIKHLPAQLSGGERQRVAIARALINDPELIFCDEPTGNLDTANAENIHQLLVKLNEEHNISFLFVTHNKELSSKGHRLLYMLDGKIIDEKHQNSKKSK